MPVTITNRTKRPVILTLSSGATQHLAPQATSPALPDVEVKNNPKVDKLISRLLISIDTAPPAAPAAQPEEMSDTAAETTVAPAEAQESGIEKRAGRKLASRK